MTQNDANMFCPYLDLMPEDALRVPMMETMECLAKYYGIDFEGALNPKISVPSPVQHEPNGQWAKRMHAVGVNIRTIGHFWNLIPYSMTLPAAQNAVHILPIWEPGVVASLYGPASWNINPEFFSAELAQIFPHLDTVEKQLKATVNVLHLLGKAVGMDVVPHTDRYSEMALGNPWLFEWLVRDDDRIVAHSEQTYLDAQHLLYQYIKQYGSAVQPIAVPASEAAFWGETTESERLAILFGTPSDYTGRLERRKHMVQLLYDAGLETVPATMGPPYRGIEVDPTPSAMTVDEAGRTWRDYRITKPQVFSRVFGPLARYKFYFSENDNRDWVLDFSRPQTAAWEYVCQHYGQIQAEYGFDFMRGDMSHVQMRPNGVPVQPDAFYDPLGAVKQSVLPQKPYFAYFAESFLAPPDEMAYGDECAHLEASFADSTLGDLQSEPVGTEKFVRDFAQYRHWLETRQFAPNFTLMTADKDDPRFDKFYLEGNEIRYFLGLFLADMPSYMGLGFECRDLHPTPAPNEHYTKLYVFQERSGPKATSGRYRWGQNRKLYAQLVRQKHFANSLWPALKDAPLHWLLPPDPKGLRKTIVWLLAMEKPLIFVANLDTKQPAEQLSFDCPLPNLEWIFSTTGETPPVWHLSGQTLQISTLAPGEGAVFKGIDNG